MSDESNIELVHNFLSGASAASKRHDLQGTHYFLSQAEDAASEIEDNRARRFAWSRVTIEAVNVQYPELSQQLAQKLIRLDRKLGSTPWIITDLLSYGSSLHHSGQHLEAEEVYRQAYDLAMEIKSWQHAAAASSNYAMAIAARGALEDAQVWLQRSLEYLLRTPDLDTEIRTRAMLIQIKHALGEQPASCLEKARLLLDKHAVEMKENHRNVLRNALDTVLKSFFTDNPDIVPDAWIEEHLPELMEKTND